MDETACPGSQVKRGAVVPLWERLQPYADEERMEESLKAREPARLTPELSSNLCAQLNAQELTHRSKELRKKNQNVVKWTGS